MPSMETFDDETTFVERFAPVRLLSTLDLDEILTKTRISVNIPAKSTVESSPSVMVSIMLGTSCC